MRLCTWAHGSNAAGGRVWDAQSPRVQEAVAPAAVRSSVALHSAMHRGHMCGTSGTHADDDLLARVDESGRSAAVAAAAAGRAHDAVAAVGGIGVVEAPLPRDAVPRACSVLWLQLWMWNYARALRVRTPQLPEFARPWRCAPRPRARAPLPPSCRQSYSSSLDDVMARLDALRPHK